jgi:hypothetical protein
VIGPELRETGWLEVGAALPILPVGVWASRPA